MSFLNPAILWGLAAVSIPVIIHLFNLKRTKKVEFSTLMFLKEIQQSQYRKIRLKQLLILLCRAGMILLMVMAFSRPFVGGYAGKPGEKTRSSVLIIIDDSFSMQARDIGGIRLDKARSKAVELTGLLDGNDEVFFSTVSHIEKGPVLFEDLDALRDSINKVRTSDITKDLSDLLFYTGKTSANFSYPVKEIFLITDGQKSFIKGGGFAPFRPDYGENASYNIILTGNRSANNISVDTIDIRTRIFEKNRPVKIKCTLTNHNGFNVTNKNILINYAPGNFREEKTADIPANSSVELEFTLVPGASGFSGGYIELAQDEIADDEIMSDNRRYFTFYVPTEIKLLIAAPAGAETGFIELALSSSEELTKKTNGTSSPDVNGFFKTRIIRDNAIAEENLNEYDCIMIAGKMAFTDKEAENLNSYLKNGGGLIIYPGEKISIDNYNDMLMSKLDLPAINPSFSTPPGEQPAGFEKIDYQHPVFEGMFKSSDPQGRELKESPAVVSGVDLISSGGGSRPLIRLSNEKNFLVEYSSGTGKILFYALAPDLSASDFPAKSIFAPLTLRSIMYAARLPEVKEGITGSDYFFDPREINKSSFPDSVKITAGAVPNVSFNLPLEDNLQLLNLRNLLDVSSNYRISSGTEVLHEFPCGFNINESKTEVLNRDDVQNSINEKYGFNANVIADNSELTASVLELRTGKEVWGYFLVAALSLLIAEFIVARSFSRN